MYADVIVDIVRSEADKIFEYSFTDETIKTGSRVIVPFGNKKIEGIVVNVKTECEYSPSKVKPIIESLDPVPALTAESVALMDYMRGTCYVSRAQALRLFLPGEMRKGKVKEQIVRYAILSDGFNRSEISLLRKSAVKQKEFLEYMLENGKTRISVANEKFGSQAVKSCEAKGYIVVTEEKENRSPYLSLSAAKKDIVLTEKQTAAVNEILKTDKLATLLFGVTGSGKTEVYLNLIDKAIRQGKTAIMLVPEIALTPQMLSQLRARFGDAAAILHSGLSAGERFDEWWRLRSGEAKIAIGARSAIFAPVENVGIIIIDEEHDGSYTSESAPRYATVDVATFRAKYNGAKLVLGSATPSVDSFLLAEKGEYNLVTLPDRINKKPLPQVEIADMRQEVRRGNNTVFSSALREELKKCLDSGNQAIIFLNQRGYSKTVICAECGHVQKCSDCDVALTYHKEEDALLCHYCGAKYKMITACTECGSKFLKYGGTGTEKVVYDLQKMFPEAKILRMDRDTTKNKEGHFKILSAFSERKADILVGTQMIAKGHDFPFVTLVGILDADMSLHFSDFRSAERTYQLLTQVAGRSGRAGNAGKVVLQTYSPDNFVLRKAIAYDYEGFYRHEISIRKATGFPPFYDIVRVMIKCDDERAAVEATKALYGELLSFYNQNKEKFRFFGAMKAPIKRLQSQYRYQILMRTEKNNKEILDTVYYSSEKYNRGKIFVSMEINPNNLS